MLFVCFVFFFFVRFLVGLFLYVFFSSKIVLFFVEEKDEQIQSNCYEVPW